MYKSFATKLKCDVTAIGRGVKMSLERPHWAKGPGWGQWVRRGTSAPSSAWGPRTPRGALRSPPAVPATWGANLQKKTMVFLSGRFPAQPPWVLWLVGPGLGEPQQTEEDGQIKHILPEKTLLFLVMSRAASSHSVPLLFRWSPGWNELVGKRVDTCWCRDWWLRLQKPLAFRSAEDCSLFGL